MAALGSGALEQARVFNGNGGLVTQQADHAQLGFAELARLRVRDVHHPHHALADLERQADDGALPFGRGAGIQGMREHVVDDNRLPGAGNGIGQATRARVGDGLPAPAVGPQRSTEGQPPVVLGMVEEDVRVARLGQEVQGAFQDGIQHRFQLQAGGQAQAGLAQRHQLG